MQDQYFFLGRDGHPGFGAYWPVFDEDVSDAATGFVRLYPHTDGWKEKRGSTVRRFALEQQANTFTLLNRFKDVQLDDQDGTPTANRRLRNIDARILATNDSNVEGRHISRLSIELLEDSDLVESYILADGSRAFSGDASMGGNLLNDVADPVDPQDAATKAYVDAAGGNPVQEAHTASDTLTAAESGSVHTNEGAAGDITLTLPAAAAGLHFYFQVVTGTVNLQIAPAAGDSVRVLGVSGTTNARASTKGNGVHFRAYNGTEWIAQSVAGAWSVT